MKENKDQILKFRLTQKDKEEIVAYCQKHNLTISEFLRVAYIRMMNQKEGE